MREAQARRGAIVVGLSAALFALRFAFASPTFVGVTFLLVLPTVLAALWFGVRGGLAVALAAGIVFFAVERLDPSMDASFDTVLLAALVRTCGLALAGRWWRCCSVAATSSSRSRVRAAARCCSSATWSARGWRRLGGRCSCGPRS